MRSASGKRSAFAYSGLSSTISIEKPHIWPIVASALPTCPAPMIRSVAGRSWTSSITWYESPEGAFRRPVGRPARSRYIVSVECRRKASAASALMAASNTASPRLPAADPSGWKSILAPSWTSASPGVAMTVATNTEGPPSRAAATSARMIAAGTSVTRLNERQELEPVAERVTAEEALTAVDGNRLLELNARRAQPGPQAGKVIDEERGMPGRAVLPELPARPEQ